MKKNEMVILPAWLIEEIKKMEEFKRRNIDDRPRVFIDAPTLPAPINQDDVQVEDNATFSFI